MIQEAVKSLRSGMPVLIFDSDDREGETDMVYASQFIRPESIRSMRKDGGGLICTTIKMEDALLTRLPYIEDLYKTLDIPNITNADDLKYDKNSTFSITVNSRETFTGIPDIDRAKTVKDISFYIDNLRRKKMDYNDFGRIFRSPGHIHLLIASDGYFKKRRGHTELSTYLVEISGLIPSATIVEMLSDTGRSMTMEEAMAYARNHNYTFITGDEIISHWSGSN
ncbi:3,4-dihydroxy-2-butanone-4-phosphate synthase [Picrophilus oshimae]|uniref:3,4-dihydroxy-2-butanone 4-phosphate synthase n=1 Tax=Picrophilus torridus (strain ATCC 700027 / DSM 9790 / JCM 10055 / NBRC 100828 / KAW 2/3) TaxID=1122961 RepID=Q6L155_PICTO|nr:3,4-dihydroxy-2-butanone-4-phosphate synthase [Picrophilus oshimae]AAT43297.1 3,4-dihydroxy-2-butanone 4-phosphate synthase [Picrophilus oshimae DSM 9789]SMD30395.1 3,4-dihydroxy-2-butanone 4-phosphate synthase [Picrophilus oshimae DSM 9789]